MSYYKKQEFDFVSRTKEIIKQYESNQVPQEKKYEVTLLLNCFVGLLMLPQKEWSNNYPTELITEEKWGINPDWITFCSQKTVNEVARHIRNSVAHYRFVAFDDTSKEIDRIKFEDYKCYKKDNQDIEEKTFEAIISIDNLRKFIYKLTDDLISQMK
jgi:c-di-AMP phosphodiesterase-like protein